MTIAAATLRCRGNYECVGRERWHRLVLALAAITVAQPAALWAHPRLARAVPAQGARLTPAPTEIRLTFTEVAELTFTRLTLLAQGGDTIRLSEARHATDDTHTVVAAISDALAPGEFVVVWQTAGPDGHPIRGRYTFTVAAGTVASDASPGETGATVTAPGQAPPPATHHRRSTAGDIGSDSGFNAESPLFALVRWVLYTGLLVVIGAVVFHRVVLGRVNRAGGPANVAVIRSAAGRAAVAGLLGAGVLLLSIVARLVAQSYALHGADDVLEPGLIGAMLTRTVWGWGWLLQLGGAGLALAGFAMARVAPETDWLAAELAALLLGFTPALSGHAVSAEGWVPPAVLADGIHVLGAGAWIGTLLLVVTVGLPVVLRLDVAERGRAAADLINAFSPVALAAAALLVLTGLVAAWIHVGTVSALWSTGYGRTLLLKLGVLIVVAGTGAYNWRRVRPALGDELGARRIRKSATVELAVAAVVLVVTAVLVATPTPRSMERGISGAAADSRGSVSNPV
ncbi:MAG: copper resistance protein CopC/CopD [Gemmatimonadales bacterium]|nr:copper resistance protein CopC/CopD [Gemmatimonadales bacterium]